MSRQSQQQLNSRSSGAPSQPSQSVATQTQTAQSAQVNQIARDLLSLQQSVNQTRASGLLTQASKRSAAAVVASAAASSATPPAPCQDLPAPSAQKGACNDCTKAEYISELEQQLLRAQVPLEVNETEEITVNGERGLWVNRNEVINWKGDLPITEYLINEDSQPEIITKRAEQQLEYVQELAIRYLRPPT
jgi:hypothetical protein